MNTQELFIFLISYSSTQSAATYSIPKSRRLSMRRHTVAPNQFANFVPIFFFSMCSCASCVHFNDVVLIPTADCCGRCDQDMRNAHCMHSHVCLTRLLVRNAFQPTLASAMANDANERPTKNNIDPAVRFLAGRLCSHAASVCVEMHTEVMYATFLPLHTLLSHPIYSTESNTVGWPGAFAFDD